MKQILPKLKEFNKLLKFVKMSTSGTSFRHITQYINGLITLNRKPVKKISEASIEEKHHSAISRVLASSQFGASKLEERYLKKISYYLRYSKKYLLFDDTLNIRNGKHIEETKLHHNHTDNNFVTGHQYFTAIIHTKILQLPLFPKLYSDFTESKIEMARDCVDKVIKHIGVDCVLFDSWYSDKKLIKKCITKNIKVICTIKTNRKISTRKGNWEKLSVFSKEQIFGNKLELIDDCKYQINEHIVKLNGIPNIKLLISKMWDYKRKRWLLPFHLISTDKRDSTVKIIREYSYRWFIETYHRDIKQNLGFNKCQARKKEVIVSHAILVLLAYAMLKLFMFLRNLDLTIGGGCAHIQNKEMNNFILEIVEIKDKNERIKYFQEVFIRKTAKV